MTPPLSIPSIELPEIPSLQFLQSSITIDRTTFSNINLLYFAFVKKILYIIMENNCFNFRKIDLIEGRELK